MEEFAQFIGKTYGGVDILVNNAAVLYKVSFNEKKTIRLTTRTNIYRLYLNKEIGSVGGKSARKRANRDEFHFGPEPHKRVFPLVQIECSNRECIESNGNAMVCQE